MMGGIILLDNSAELGQAMPERKDGNSVPALIMGLGHPRQTAYVKSLANVGVPVHAVHTKQTAFQFSRHLKSFHQIDADPEKQLDYLERFGREVGGIIVPTNDDYVGWCRKIESGCQNILSFLSPTGRSWEQFLIARPATPWQSP